MPPRLILMINMKDWEFDIHRLESPRTLIPLQRPPLRPTGAESQMGMGLQMVISQVKCRYVNSLSRIWIVYNLIRCICEKPCYNPPISGSHKVQDGSTTGSRWQHIF